MIGFIVGLAIGIWLGWYAFVKNPRIGEVFWIVWATVWSWVRFLWGKLSGKKE